MTTDQFVHLHVHTEYSMLDGAAQIKPLMARVRELNQPAVGVTDHGFMFGVFEFWEVANKTGVKPIMGIEAYVAPASRWHKEPVYWGEVHQRKTNDQGMGGDVSGTGAFTHMTMLARDVTGLRNLLTLTSLASLQGMYRKPRMDRELIAENAAGIIATTGCPSGEVQTRLRLGQTREAFDAAAAYRDIFGAENFYVELMDHGLPIERSVRQGLLDISRDLGIKPVCTNDSHYVTEDQADAHAALLCVQSGKTLSDPDRFKFDGSGYYVKTGEEMRRYWDREVPGAADATLEIAEKVESYAEAFAFRDMMPVFDVWDVTPLMRAARDVLNVRLVGDESALAAARPLIVRVDKVDAVAPLREVLAGADRGETPVGVMLCGGSDTRADEETMVSARDFPVTLSGELLQSLHRIDGVTVD